MSRPHLTEAMRDAAERYAKRLMGRGIPLIASWDEASRLARLGMLTVDGYKKPVHRPKRKKTTKR